MKVMKVITDAAVVKANGRYKGQAGILILDEEDIIYDYVSDQLGNVTSNEGEYLALGKGMSVLSTVNDDTDYKVELYTDSKLIFNQLTGANKTKKNAFKAMQKNILEACKCYKGSKIIWHRREKALAVLADFASKNPRRTKSLAKQLKGKHVSELTKKAVAFLLKDEAREEAAR